jgi:uncharacterized coiled-coil protein SlyX
LLKLKSEAYSAFFVLSLVNSSLLNWYFKVRFPITDVDGYMLHQVPIRRIEFTTPEKKRAALVDKAKQLYQRSVSDAKPDRVLAFVTEQLAAKPERTDVVHDLLAFLAERMMAMNQQKRTTAKQFLTDLKDFHDVDTHALKPKTKLDKFWKLEAAEIFAHFRANKLRLKESDEENIRARFQKAKDQLVPLETQIAFTDQLIDEIVYRLYGLTEAEIKIVSIRGCNSSMVRVA